MYADTSYADGQPSDAMATTHLLVRMEFWKMKALEKRLSCPISPGEIINPERKIAHFTSLSPSPTKRLTFADDAGEIGISTAVKSSEETSGDDCKVEDELYLPKNDKSFEKAVDWTKPETSKVIFSAADMNSDVTQFFNDFEEIMADTGSRGTASSGILSVCVFTSGSLKPLASINSLPAPGVSGCRW